MRRFGRAILRGLRRAGRALIVLFAVLLAYGSYLYLTLPDVRPLRTENPATTAFIELRAREAGARGENPRRVQRWVPYARISAELKRAVLVAEDGKFWTHDGVDLEQIRESIEVNYERGEFARGASTITQQLAKNLYLSPSKNPIRKLRELFIARRLEAELSKQRILEIYLNVIEWGDGIYGAEAAARTYFRKSASQLNSEEAALLAGAIVNPRLLNPGQPTARLRRRKQMLLARMGFVTPPPVLPVLQPAPADATIEPVEPLPLPTTPEALPGQVQPLPAPPPPKPPGGPGGP